MKNKYQVTTSFYFPEHIKNKFTDKIKAVLCENNSDGTLKKEVAYFLNKEDAERACNMLNGEIYYD